MASPSVKIPSSYTHTINFGAGLTIITTPMNVNTKVTGDRNNPVASLVLGDPNMPVGVDSKVKVTGDKAQPIGSHVTGDKNNPVASLITGDPSQPIGSQIDLLNLPHLTKQDIKDLLTPEIRMHIPHYSQMCLKVLGTEVLSLCFSGESQVVTEPYVPNAYERCETDCCEPDTRPFPTRPSTQVGNDNPSAQNPTAARALRRN